jgi:predicted nucleic acid-binding protein
MTRWCLDANVVIAILLDEHVTEAARSFWFALNENDELIAPQVLLPECASVLRRKVNEAVITADEGSRLLGRLLSFPIDIESSRFQFSLAFAWALETNRTKMHDLQYVAVAQIRGANVVTIDGGLRQIAVERGVPVTVIQ